MSEYKAVIFGAGKIARGFIGHLLTLSGVKITFVDRQPELVRLLRERRAYRVHIFGRPERSAVIDGFDALELGETDRIADALSEADLAFTAVGGPNLPGLAPALAAGVRLRAAAGAGPLNLITCENYYRPADSLRTAVAALLDAESRTYFEQRVGLAEATVLRSVIEPTAAQVQEDPLALQAQDHWTLEADADRLILPLPPVEGLKPVERFYGALERKLFTYNATNATISYLGILKGHYFLHEAAHDPQILEVVRGVQAEVSPAICRKHGYTEQEQAEFAAGALRKFGNATIQDPLERQVRDPIRKLGRNDRLVGAACLVLETGGRPEHLALAIAAALTYCNPTDPSAPRLAALVAERGLEAALAEVAGLPLEHPLVGLVREAYPRLAEFQA